MLTQSMSVQLMSKPTMSADLLVVNAARVSFAKEVEQFSDDDARLIDFLARHNHTTPFRHPYFTLRCSAPLFVARQLGKHQVGMVWNEVSRRYVDDNITFYEFNAFRNRPEDGIKQGSGEAVDEATQEEMEQGYIMTVMSSLAQYQLMISRGIAPEQARAVLPQSMMVEWVWTGSLLAFFNVHAQRSDSHAQVEAQLFAEMLASVMEDAAPESWAALNKYIGE